MSRNSDTLSDFVRYCEDHPQDRFWQALRNWSGERFILFSGTAPVFITDSEDVEFARLRDTFYREGK